MSNHLFEGSIHYLPRVTSGLEGAFDEISTGLACLDLSLRKCFMLWSRCLEGDDENPELNMLLCSFVSQELTARRLFTTAHALIGHTKAVRVRPRGHLLAQVKDNGHLEPYNEPTVIVQL